MSENDTLPKLLLEHARLRGDRPAYREKDLGIWQTWSWSETEKEIRNLSCGLKQLGFERGDNWQSSAITAHAFTGRSWRLNAWEEFLSLSIRIQ